MCESCPKKSGGERPNAASRGSAAAKKEVSRRSAVHAELPYEKRRSSVTMGVMGKSHERPTGG